MLEPSLPAATRKKVLLVGWDAADWKFLNPLMDAGELPALNQLVESGVAGELLTVQPSVPAAQWTSVVTGKRPWQHGVTHAREFDVARGQPIPISRAQRRATALWEMLAREGRRSVVVGWPATQGSRTDLVNVVSDRYSEPTAPPGVKPWPPARPGTYWPESLSGALDPLRVSPEGLGADVLGHFIPQWRRIDQQRDRRLGQLRVLLAADFSHVAAASYLLEHTEWDLAAVRFPALGHIARQFLPFHPPRREWVGEGEFELYREVIRTACRTLDSALAHLRKLAGPDTLVVVVSAHGTRVPDVAPFGFPQNDEWKSPYGILAAAGPGVAADRLLHGASVLDVTPTLLSWFGLPLGEDMEGRVWVEAFDALPEIQRVATWEKASDPAAPADWKSAIQQTGSLRYAGAAPGAQSPAAELLLQEAQWNLVQSCLEAGRLAEALPHLQELFRAFPERADFSQALFHCQLNLEQLPEAEQTLAVLLESVPPGAAALLPQAELALAKRDVRLARLRVAEVERLQPTHPALLRRLGLLLLGLREWKALAELAQRALQLDENEPIAWLALAEASLRQHQPAQAEEAASRAIQLKYFLPDAHFVLARALVAQSKWEEARQVMAALVRLQPDNKSVAGYHRRLAR